MLGWFYHTMKIRLGGKVKRAMWCSIWFSDSVLHSVHPTAPPPPDTHTQTHNLRVSCRGCRSCLSLRDSGRTGYWSDRLLSELKLFIMLSALTREPPSLMDHGVALPHTCPCHPHTLRIIDPHITRPCPTGAPLSGGGWLWTEICSLAVSPCWSFSALSSQKLPSHWELHFGINNEHNNIIWPLWYSFFESSFSYLKGHSSV